jgi:hypothetical protein
VLTNRLRGIQISQRTVIISVLIMGLLLSTFTGALIAMDRMYIALFPVVIILGIGGIIFASQRSLTIIRALPVIALAVPIALPTGTESKIPIVMALILMQCMLWIASMSFRGWRLQPSPLNRPMLIFCVVMLLAFVWGFVWRDPILWIWNSFPMVQAASLICYFASIGAALLVGNFMTEERHLRWLMGCFVVFGALMVVKTSLKIPLEFLTVKGLWALWFVAPAWALAIGHPKLKWYWRATLVALVGWCMFEVMIRDSGWISGWAPSLVAIACITLFHSRKLFLAILPVILVALALNWGFFIQVFEADQKEGSAERVGLWEKNLSIVREHWLLGTGPAGYAVYNMTYFAEDARSTHNNYFDILAQFGTIGFVVWWWLALAGIFEGWHLIQRAPPGFLRTLALAATGGWIAALVSMMLGDWVLPFAYNQTIGGFQYTVFSWLFLGSLISIRTILQREGLLYVGAPKPRPAS